MRGHLNKIGIERMAKKQQAKNQSPSRKLVRFDWFVKNLLRHKADFEILEGFLSELLKDEIKILKVLDIIESEGNKRDKLDKFNRVDVLVKTSSGERIIIEVQNTRELDYLQRILYGTSKVVTENIVEGQMYKEIKRVISISVVYFELGQGTDYVYRGSIDFIGIHDNDKLQLSQEQLDFFGNKIKSIDELFPRYYLIRAKDFKDEINDALDEWIYFFKNARVHGKVKAKGLEKAKKRLDIANLSDPDRRHYDKYLESLHDEASYKAQLDFDAKNLAKEMAEGIAKEMAEGIAKEIITTKLDEQNQKIAENLLKKGLDNEFISQTTGLTIKKIKQLKAKLTKD